MLMFAAQVFEKLFTSELQGSAHPTITVESPAEKDALIELLRFCYTKALSHNLASEKESLLTALLLADRYAVTNAIPVIVAAMQKVATLNNVCRYLDLPRSITSQEAFQELMSFCKQFIGVEMADLDEAYRTGKYETLNLRGLWYALINDQAVVACEHTVFAMVWKWTRGRKGSAKHFHRLSSLIRYHHMTSSFLVAIQQLPECSHPGVASAIRKALLFRGLPNHGEGVLLASKDLEVCFESVFKPRPGFISPLKCELDWVVDLSILEPLEPGAKLVDIGSKEAFGYSFECSLGRSGESLQFCLAYTIFCSEVERVEAGIVFDVRLGVGEGSVDEALVVERSKQGKPGGFLYEVPWFDEHGEGLHASHYIVDRKLRGKFLLTLL